MDNNIIQAYELLEEARLAELSKSSKLSRRELINVIICAAGALKQEIEKC